MNCDSTGNCLAPLAYFSIAASRYCCHGWNRGWRQERRVGTRERTLAGRDRAAAGRDRETESPGGGSAPRAKAPSRALLERRAAGRAEKARPQTRRSLWAQRSRSYWAQSYDRNLGIAAPAQAEPAPAPGKYDEKLVMRRPCCADRASSIRSGASQDLRPEIGNRQSTTATWAEPRGGASRLLQNCQERGNQDRF